MTAPLLLPRITGRSVVLRGFLDSDAPLIQQVSSDPVIPASTTVPTTPDLGAALAFIERQRSRAADGIGYSFAIADQRTDEPLGQVGLWPLPHGRASVGYWVAEQQRRRGLASQAIDLISTWGLALPGTERLELYVEPWNEGSWRAAERAGFAREGLLRSWQEVNGTRRDMFMYARLR